MMLTEVSSGPLLILGFLLLGLGALVKRALEYTEKWAVIRREQEITDAMKAGRKETRAADDWNTDHASHRENSRTTRAGAA